MASAGLMSAFDDAVFKEFVTLLDLCGGFGVELFEEAEELFGIEGLQGVVGSGAGSAPGGADDDDGGCRA